MSSAKHKDSAPGPPADQPVGYASCRGLTGTTIGPIGAVGPTLAGDTTMRKRPTALLMLLLAPATWVAGCAHTREVYYPRRPAEPAGTTRRPAGPNELPVVCRQTDRLTPPRG